MKFSITLIALLLKIVLSIDSSAPCSTLACGTNTTTWGYCIVPQSSNVTVNICPSNYQCSGLSQFSSTQSYTISQCAYSPPSGITLAECPGTGTFVTNDLCCTNSDCFSGYCTNNHCKGVPKGNPCEIDDHCVPGAWCNTTSTLCQGSQSSGDSCSKDNQCPTGYGCNNEVCDKLLAGSSENLVTHAGFCETKIVNSQLKCDEISVYVDSKKLSEPYMCTVPSTCTYKYLDGTTYNTSACQCAGIGSTVGYCNPSYGGLVDIAGNFWSRFQYTDTNCSGTEGHSYSVSTLYDCAAINYDGYYYYEQMLMIFKSWPIYQSGVLDGCSSEIGLFDSKYSLSTWSGAERLIASMTFMVFTLG